MSRKFTGNVERDAHGFLTVILPSNDWAEGSTVEVTLVSLPKNKPPHRNPSPHGLGGLHTSPPVAPHCEGHSEFEYDCIDCSDSLERLREGI